MSGRADGFGFDWDTEVPEETRDRLFDQIVRVVRRWRLEVPAAMFLEMGAPLSHLAGQGLVLYAPFLAPALPGGISDLQRLSKLLEKPQNVRLLIDRIAEAGENTEARQNAARQ